VNYFGHAALAILCNESPAFVLGAMLPDLAQMVGVHVSDAESSVDRDVRAGLNFHLKTDAHFHDTATFRSLNLRSLSEFKRMEVSKGPARACAHIGVEMLIDAELAQRTQFQTPYHEALRFGVQNHERLGCASPEARRVCGLLQHLDDKGITLHAATEERFILRLERALGARKRLRPTPHELAAMVRYLCDLTDIPERTIALLDELAPLVAPGQGSPLRRPQ
jgi:hypothetical protein